jgi:hypothetical protein
MIKAAIMVAMLLFARAPLTAERVRVPGRIDVVYSEGLDDTRRRAVEKAIGLPVQLEPYRTAMDGDNVKSRVFRYPVPRGQETFWVMVLQSSPLVASAEWPEELGQTESPSASLVARNALRKGPDQTLTFSSIASICLPPGTIAHVHGRLDSENLRDYESYPVLGSFPKSSENTCSGTLSSHWQETLRASLEQANVTTLLRSYFTDMYRAKNAQLRVLGSDENFLHFQVDHLRGEVIRGSRYWEQIEVNLVYFPVREGVKLHLFLDGKFAAGMGRMPPVDSAFSNMEQEHYEQENDYLNAMAAGVSDFLRSGQLR